ncbi:MAG: GFA family protein [Acidobacteriota bacterium]|nr:GFA family protein [Acidobacteriota bacterium]
MKKVNAANYRKDKLYPNVCKAVTAILAEKDAVTPIEVFRRMDYLSESAEDDWRNGKAPYLEKVLIANLAKLSRVLRILHCHAVSSNMSWRIHPYTRKTKNGRMPLRFTKSGDRNLEEAYARHYLLKRKTPNPETHTCEAKPGSGKPFKRKQPVKNYEGGCLCGAVRYRAERGPLKVVNCHCARCRKAVGAPMVAWADFPAEGFTFTKGNPKRYQSSPDLVREFCVECGTSLTNHAVENPAVISVTTASMDEPVKVDMHIWTAAKFNWVVVGGKMKSYRQGEPE